MGEKKKKIVIASDEDVWRYGGHKSDTAGAPAGSESQDDAAQTEGCSPEAPATTEAEQWKEKCLRAKAELVNFQRRSEKERDEAIRYAIAPLVRALLPILDDLQRVVTSGREHPDNASAILDGVQLTIENFQKALRDAHVQPIDAEGMVFDPHEHEAMMEQPSAEHSDRVVLQEVQKGYRLHDRVLRPAKVVVSKPMGQGTDGGQEER